MEAGQGTRKISFSAPWQYSFSHGDSLICARGRRGRGSVSERQRARDAALACTAGTYRVTVGVKVANKVADKGRDAWNDN